MNGLFMLVAQAKTAAEHFMDTTLSDTKLAEIHHSLRAQMENIILIGMPGCGKSTIGRLLAEKTGKHFVDADTEIENMAQKTIPRMFAEDGEAVFRDYETKVLDALGKRSGLVIATGGGCVTKMRNYPLLHQNGTIFWLQRELDQLPTEGRPLSTDLAAMYRTRAPLYAQFADHILDNNGTLDDAITAILEVFS